MGTNIRAKVQGPEDPATLVSISDLSIFYGNLRKERDSEALHRQALKLRDKTLGPAHPDTLVSINDLGTSLIRQRKYKEIRKKHFNEHLSSGRECWGQSIRKRRSAYISFPSYVADKTSLTLSRQGMHEEAEQMAQRVLERKEKALRPDSQLVLRSPE